MGFVAAFLVSVAWLVEITPYLHRMETSKSTAEWLVSS